MIDGGFVAANGRAALRVRSMVASLPRMVELLCMRDQWWLRCRGWSNCFACAIDGGFVAADGRAALRVRTMVASLPRVAELLCVRDRSWLRCYGWSSCFACAIDGGFVDADGRAASHADQQIHTMSLLKREQAKASNSACCSYSSPIVHALSKLPDLEKAQLRDI